MRKHGATKQKAHQCFSEPYALDSQAAALLADDPSCEPMRSILNRSAASLALNFEQYRLAEKLTVQNPTARSGFELHLIF